MIVLSNRPASRLFTSRTRSDARSVSDGLSAVAANIPLARALQHIEFDDVTDDDPWWRKTIMTVKQALPVILPVVETLFLDDVYDKKPSLSAITARQERLFRLRKAQEAQEESIAYQ